MLERVKSYFRHYRSERNGVIVFAVLLFLVVVGFEVYQWLYEPEIERVDVLFLDDSDVVIKSDSLLDFSATQSESSLFSFNPNTLGDSGYLALGFSKREIKTLRNYQKAGADFEIKKDFEKLFFVDAEEYARLEPFIELPVSKPRKDIAKASEKVVTEPDVKWSDTASTDLYTFHTFSCNLNTADTNELKRLNGIGSFYANKIIEYRDKLGGYHNLGQLLELWKMTPEKIDKFADQLVVDTSELKQIDINVASAYELSQHPYLSFGKANEIVLHRESSGYFSDSESFCSVGLLDADLCRKLVPYLIFGE